RSVVPFFFQAEDGIRDYKVTGVQTCALPIFCQVDRGRWATLEGIATIATDPQSVAEAELRYAERYRTPEPNPDRVVIEIALTSRSEERRVGKEGRAGGAEGQDKSRESRMREQ